MMRVAGPPLTLRDRMQSGVVRGLAGLPDAAIRLLVGRPTVRDGQRLHPETQLALKLLAMAGAPELEELTPDQARARVAQDARTFEGPKVGLDEVRELELPGATKSIPARLYVPDASEADGALVVYFHGGGFVVGDLDTHDNACRFLARHSGARIVSVDYRRAPESPFPAPLDDALAAFRWVFEQAPELGAHPRRIGVAGDSAGANLAAGVARLSRRDGDPAPEFQLLFYPWLDLAHKRPSYRLFGQGFYLTESDLDWYAGKYLTRTDDAQDPRCSPLQAEDLEGLPPTYVATAGFDPLRDEGEEFARRLRDAGVPVALRRHAGLIHGFVNTVSVGHVGREAVLEAAGALRLGLALREGGSPGGPRSF
jgi:acetyl esterase